MKKYINTVNFVIFITCAFLLVLIFAPIDEGIPTQGSVVSETKSKLVQHLKGGVIEEIFVKEGDYVSAGQKLLRLDNSNILAEIESLKQKYILNSVARSRLIAERNNSKKIQFDIIGDELFDSSAVNFVINNEGKVFQTRRDLYISKINEFDNSIHAQKKMILRHEEYKKLKNKKVRLLEDQIKSLEHLVDLRIININNLLDVQKNLIDTKSELNQIEFNILESEILIADLQKKKTTFLNDHLKSLDDEINEYNYSLLGLREQIIALEDELSRLHIDAPVEGQIFGLNLQTVKGVVQPGQTIMQIAPLNDKLVIESKIPTHAIDRVSDLMHVKIRFNGFKNTPQLVVDGVLKSVSKDILKEVDQKSEFYLARVEVTEDGFKQLGSRSLHVGMPVEVLLKGGERSMLTYLLHPLIKRWSTSMTEE